MSKYDTSALQLGNIFVNTEPYRGGVGPTGSTGPTGATGPIGNVGSRGTGVSVILKTNSDGITVFLTNSTGINVSGLSGNTFVDYESVASFYSLNGATGVDINTSFEVKGSVQGFTAGFKSVYFLGGICGAYSGSDIKISGTSGASTKLGSAGNILVGVTNDVTEGFNVNLFKYEENIVGITTVPVLKAKLSSFIQPNFGVNRSFVNVHTSDPLFTLGGLISGSTQNIYFPQTIFNAISQGITGVDVVSTEYAKVKSGQFNKKINVTSTLISSNNPKVSYGVYEYGSCCHCNDVGLSRCRDFIGKNYCETAVDSGGLGGVFSFRSCEQRKTSDCTAVSKCCINGICLDLEMGECARLGGIATEGSFCNDTFDC
jgi:hypothetical protein